MVIFKASPDIKEVALLFDDGPNPLITPRLLKVLQEKRVAANFFLVGMRAEQSPEIVKQIANAGHEIGNHTYTHKRLPQLFEEQGEQAVIDEVIKGRRAIEKTSGIDGEQIKFLRPPYLDWNNDIDKILKPAYGDNIMMSDLAVRDWDWGVNHDWDKDDLKAINNQAKLIVQQWWRITANGTLLGFHDSSEHNLPGNKQYDTWMNRALPTLEAIPRIIDLLFANGFAIKRLSEMKLIKEASATSSIEK